MVQFGEIRCGENAVRKHGIVQNTRIKFKPCNQINRKNRTSILTLHPAYNKTCKAVKAVENKFTRYQSFI